jgi:alpha-1,2-mannosyltransferase
MNTRPRDRLLRWCAATLAISFLLTAAVFLGITVAKGPTAQTITRALRGTAPFQVLRLLEISGADSWTPMITAYQQKVKDPKTDLYAVFFVDRVKFQYPPSSLLIFDLFPRSMINLTDVTQLVGPLKRWLDTLSQIAAGVTVLASVVILELGVRRLPSVQRVQPARVSASVGLSLAVGLTFYPLLFAHDLGQIQVFLNALLALAVLFSVIGWQGLAGICFGVCCLVKPQYGLVLLWSLVRRQWRFTLGLVGVLLPGLAISIARFGLADHLRYLDVVRELSRVGEALWFNQSVNGLLNRLLENGSALRMPSEYPPYHPVVYALTVLSSVAILALALWPRRDAPRPNGGVLDLMIMLVAITMASPIAWIHHYGAFLPVFAAAVPALLYARPLRQATVPLFAVSYVAMANLLVWPEVVFRNRWVGLAGSHLFFGSLAFFGLLLTLRVAGSGPQGSAENR